MIEQKLLNELNAETAESRLAALMRLCENTRFPVQDRRYINNHIHTTYSFSPYSPSAAVFAARSEGLATAGIVDHDSIGGAREFIEAGRIASLPVTVGAETRVLMTGTPFESRRLNNPDQLGLGYFALHAVKHRNIEDMQLFFAGVREKRNRRNRLMCGRINELVASHELAIDFDRDVLPLSCSPEGSVTERHLMLALSRALIGRFGRGDALVGALREFGIEPSKKQLAQLSDEGYDFYDYDLLGILKSAFIPKIYIPANDECPTLDTIAQLSRKCGSILCYAYLGDVHESLSSDKKAQKCEDEYLDELVKFLADSGVDGITYMPSRNTPEQIDRLRALCERYDMFQVSGEDINSPRQSFICRAMEDERFENLIESTWELIRRENE